MLQYFDMMYYHLATFYQRFYKKTSGWQLQAAFIIGITQLILLSDIWLTIISLIKIERKINIYEKVIFFSLALFLTFYNKNRYEKKYRYYKSIWGIYEGNKKRFHIFLTFFTAIFSWLFIFILGFIFDKYK